MLIQISLHNFLLFSFNELIYFHGTCIIMIKGGRDVNNVRHDKNNLKPQRDDTMHNKINKMNKMRHLRNK